MSYRATVTATAVKERKRLDTVTRQRIDTVLRTLPENPRPSGSRKLSGSQSDWRIRVGDYRILYEIDDDAQLMDSMAYCSSSASLPITNHS